MQINVQIFSDLFHESLSKTRPSEEFLLINSGSRPHWKQKKEERKRKYLGNHQIATTVISYEYFIIYFIYLSIFPVQNKLGEKHMHTYKKEQNKLKLCSQRESK